MIHHIPYPIKFFKEMYRILKKGGKFINLTPDWEVIYKEFYDDYTHRTPFTIESLNTLNELTGFKNNYTAEFIQLPILWKFRFLKIFSSITRIIVPTSLSKFSKWIRFSKEIMIISFANKP